MISIDKSDLFIIYAKGSTGMQYYNEMYVKKEDAEQEAAKLQESHRHMESRYLPEWSNLFTTYYVATLDEFLIEYAEYKRWEGENEAEE